MKQAGTSMVRPAKVRSSVASRPLVMHRYHCRPPWKPVRSKASLNTRSSASGSQVQASIAAGDGISGATRTCDGVTHLLRFWLGPLGFGPYLERLAESSGSPEEAERGRLE